MIDYLERFFLPEHTQKLREWDGRDDAEQVLWKEISLPEQETGAELPWVRQAARLSEETAVRMGRVRPDWQEPETAERYTFPARNVREQRSDEALERRLRRDSRRYDSGFFWR